MQERCNSIVNALELGLSCTNPSIHSDKLKLMVVYTHKKNMDTNHWGEMVPYGVMVFGEHWLSNGLFTDIQTIS